MQSKLERDFKSISNFDHSVTTFQFLQMSDLYPDDGKIPQNWFEANKKKSAAYRKNKREKEVIDG